LEVIFNTIIDALVLIYATFSLSLTTFTNNDMNLSNPKFFDRNKLSAIDSSRTLFVGDLSYFCTEENLFALFSTFGSILTVRIRRGISGESLMHGFVALESPEAANAALAALDGVEFMGRNIR
jgi:RNA recognition motif-containing protein